MKDVVLFQARDSSRVNTAGILKALERVKAHEAKLLFIHSELSFGIPNPALKKTSLLGMLLQAILELNVPTICVPTFTFSFCNGQDYDVENSSSKMGVLNEYIRKLPDSVRSRDPLMSVVALGKDMRLVENLGRHSIGKGSTFDKLHQSPGAKFLFVGASPSKCMTYVHYVEKRVQVPYRYDREFTGKITDASGTTKEAYTLFVRYHDVIPAECGHYEQFLIDNGYMARVDVGDSFVSAVDVSDVHTTLADILAENIDYLLAQPYPREGLDRFFEAHNMVAL